MATSRSTAVFLMIFLGIIIIGVLITVIAVILYKRHLNKVISGEEHDLHTKVVEPKMVLRTVLICILAIWLMTITFKFDALCTDVKNLSYNMNEQYDYMTGLYSEMDNLYSKIDAQNNICEDYDFSFGKVDTDKKTVEMDLKVWLKEYSEETAVTVSFGGNSWALKNQGGVFKGNIPVDLFTDYETEPVLAVETNGMVKSQKLEQCPSGFFYDLVFPSFTCIPATDGYSISYDSKGNMVVSGNMTVFEDGPKIEGITLNTVSIAYEVDGTIIKESPLNFINGAADEIDVSESFPVENNSEFNICIKSTNSAGYTVIQSIVCYDWEQKGDIVSEGDYAVFDESGTCLFRKDYTQYK